MCRTRRGVVEHARQVAQTTGQQHACVAERRGAGHEKVALARRWARQALPPGTISPPRQRVGVPGLVRLRFSVPEALAQRSHRPPAFGTVGQVIAEEQHRAVLQRGHRRGLAALLQIRTDRAQRTCRPCCAIGGQRAIGERHPGPYPEEPRERQSTRALPGRTPRAAPVAPPPRSAADAPPRLRRHAPRPPPVQRHVPATIRRTGRTSPPPWRAVEAPASRLPRGKRYQAVHSGNRRSSLSNRPFVGLGLLGCPALLARRPAGGYRGARSMTRTPRALPCCRSCSDASAHRAACSACAARSPGSCWSPRARLLPPPPAAG